ALVEHKVALLAVLTEAVTAPAPLNTGPDPAELARVLGLPLTRLDRILRIAARWLDVPLWFVPEAEDAGALVAAGQATPGAGWTRRELLEVRTARLSKVEVRHVTLARVLFDGEIAEVRSVESLACPTCRGGRDWWHSTAGRVICRRCHPPAPGAETEA